MEISNAFSPYFSIKSVGTFLQYFLCSAIIIATYSLLKKKKLARDLGPAIPSVKIPCYSIYGHLRLLPSFSAMRQMSLPTTAYILQTFNGMAVLLEKAKLFYCRIGFTDFVVLAKPESVEELLTNNEVLEKSWFYEILHHIFGTGLLTSHGSKWRSRRKCLTPTFHFDILKEYVPVFAEKSKILVEILKQRFHEGFMDTDDLVERCTFDIMCETTLGVLVGTQTRVDAEHLEVKLRATKTMMTRIINPIIHSDIIFKLTATGKQFQKDVKFAFSFVLETIRQKKEALNEKLFEEGKKKRRALMDLLLDIHMKNPDFTENDILEEALTFTFAGHDTTAAGVSWALYLIGLHPEIQSKVHAELDAVFGDDREKSVTMDDLREMRYLECVLKETLRLYPPAPLIARNAPDDLYLCGYKIKKGTTIAVLPYILHRDPEIFPDPERFDPDRFQRENCVGRCPFSYVPFSAGSRNCIGQRFAMLALKTVVSNVLHNFTVQSMEQRDKVCVSSELILRSVQPLKLKFIPRDGK